MPAMLQQSDATSPAAASCGQTGVCAKLSGTSKPPSILRSAFHNRPSHEGTLTFIITSFRLDTTCLSVLSVRSPPTNFNT